VIIILDLNKTNKFHTLITQDKFFHNSPIKNLFHTELEDVEFEKKFDVLQMIAQVQDT